MSRVSVAPRSSSPAATIVLWIAVVGLVALGWMALQNLDLGDRGGADSAEAEEIGESIVVRLPPGKVQAISLVVQPAEVRPLQPMHVVPGRVRYDEATHIELKAPMDGILSEMPVKPGDQAEAGQLVAVISSPDIGEARAEVLKRDAELKLAERQLRRQEEVTRNLDDVLAALEQGKDIDAIEESFAGRALGPYRANLLAKYSRLRLAQEISDSVQPLAATGSIPGRTIREREMEREVAQSEFRATREEAAFETEQTLLESRAAVADAERRWRIARQQLESLLGYAEPTSPMETESSLSRLEVRAPFAGTIERRGYAQGERVARGDSLFVLADTSSLYVEADIRESDWPAVALEPGRMIQVVVPALDGATFDAEVHYVGRELAPDGNSVPLVATISNQEGLLRPGMFVRVVLPVGSEEQALAVPSQAVMQHDNRRFVFTPVSSDTFQRVDVVTGLDTGAWTAITQGLQPGQPVVADGAFLLKSELLLEGEDE